MKKLVLVLVLFSLSCFAKDSYNIKNSIVKIFTVSSDPVFKQPWTSTVAEATGSGVIIKDNLILTNAHVVTHSKFLEVLKNGDTKRYEAKIVSICHDCDLALVTVSDKSFFEGTKALKIGKLPNLEEKIAVYGFPMGGETLSITTGVISRIENQVYVHSGKSLLAIQIDAPINPGNSGGPAINDGKIVGIVMQGRRLAQNIGYVIPTTQIKHYLKDVQDGKVDGYPTVGVLIQKMENPAIREMFKLKNKKYGVLVNKIMPNSPASGKLKKNDIILEIDGYKVFSNAKVEFRKRLYTKFNYAMNRHQLGDKLHLKILRDGKQMSLTLKLTKTYEQLSLIKKKKFHNIATYYIYGGFVFVPASLEYKVPDKYFDEFPSKKRDELVMLYRVLPNELTKGFSRIRSAIIDKVDGKKYKNFKDFVSIIEHSKDKYVVFEDENNYKIVLKRDEVQKNQAKILKRYNIRSYKSDDI